MTSMPPKKTAHVQSEWTLRFKFRKITVLLLCPQNASFETIRAELLESLKARGLREINGEVLPADPEDIILGVPTDKNNMGLGWTTLAIPEFDDEGDAKKKGGVKKGSVINQTPLGAGLRDGDMLAFTFKKDTNDEMELDPNFEVTLPNLDEEVDSQSQ